ncbi:FadR/GntR family transcriptional regulator [Rhodococcus sp. NPDC058514]|uniref:FadR/GntR family transcriptional regulator n=1 Tax=unclassified Rhodococcus (in: high G+C Gram-positive bacteria) TaxID=192944 RepID=UPI00364CE9EA
MDRTDRPQKTAMIIARRIIADIEREGLRPGDRLPPERVMLEQYQVGRGTLRESLRYLELSGALSIKPGPGGGPTVQKPDGSHLMTGLGLLLQFEESPFGTVVEARVGLEPLMARMAAQNRTEEHRLDLAESVRAMEEHLDDLEAFLAANRRFHNTIAWASGNALFGYLIDAMDGVFVGAGLGVAYPRRLRGRVLEADAAILTAIADGDPDAAEEAMRAHAAQWTSYLRKNFPSELSRPIAWNVMR